MSAYIIRDFVNEISDACAAIKDARTYRDLNLKKTAQVFEEDAREYLLDVPASVLEDLKILCDELL